METYVIIDPALERACLAFYHFEAECLDDRLFEAWLELLDEGLRYDVPVRTTRENWDGSGISDSAFYMEEDYSSIVMRIKRLGSRYAWAESPATRTRRMVSNIRLTAGEGGADRLSVRSNIAVFCHRGEAAQPLIITAERFDELIVVEGGRFRLAKRKAVLDAAVLGLEALSIFL